MNDDQKTALQLTNSAFWPEADAIDGPPGPDHATVDAVAPWKRHDYRLKPE